MQHSLCITSRTNFSTSRFLEQYIVAFMYVSHQVRGKATMCGRVFFCAGTGLSFYEHVYSYNLSLFWSRNWPHRLPDSHDFVDTPERSFFEHSFLLWNEFLSVGVYMSVFFFTCLFWSGDLSWQMLVNVLVKEVGQRLLFATSSGGVVSAVKGAMWGSLENYTTIIVEQLVETSIMSRFVIATLWRFMLEI